MFEVGITPNDSETLFDLFKGSSNCLFSLWYIFPLNEPVVYTQNMSNFCKINQQTVSRTNIGKINNYRDTYKHGFEYSTLQSARLSLFGMMHLFLIHQFWQMSLGRHGCDFNHHQNSWLISSLFQHQPHRWVARRRSKRS